jgi:hypothetical protein
MFNEDPPGFVKYGLCSVISALIYPLETRIRLIFERISKVREVARGMNV